MFFNMKANCFITGVLLLAVGGLCDVHTNGNMEHLSYDVFFDKLLYAKNTTVPTNYTIIFKYTASGFSGFLGYCMFNVTANSTGTVEVDHDIDFKKPKVVKATINVYNATNLTVHATLNGMKSAVENVFTGDPFFTRTLGWGKTMFKPKSFTLIYEHNSTQTRNREVSFGDRQPGDKLIGFESKMARVTNRFAETEFEFDNEQKSITSIGFSFDSPSAIALVNSSLIGEHNVNTIVYDLNLPQFTANISIYGYETVEKPESYRQVVV